MLEGADRNRVDSWPGERIPVHVQEDAAPLIDDSFHENLRALPGMRGPSLLAEVVALYAREVVERLTEISGHAAEGRLDSVARVAHALAGGSANAGSPRARAAFTAMEKAARSGDASAVEQCIATTRRVWQELSAELARRGLLSP